MAFDLTERQAFHANARSASCAGLAGSAGFELPVRRIIAGLVHPVRGLHQHPAADRTPLHRGGRARRAAAQQADVLGRGKDFQGLGVELGRDHDLSEHLGDLPGQRRGHRAVGRDHPAERRDRVAGVRLGVRVGQVGADGDPARIGVLDDGHARLGEIVHRPPGRVRVHVVVVRHGLAVQELRSRDAIAWAGTGGSFGRKVVYIQGRALVRVLAVAQHVGTPPQGPRHLGPADVTRDLVRGVRRRRTTTRRRDRRRRCARRPRRRGAGAAPA